MTIFEVLRNNKIFGSFSDAEINQAIVFRALNGAEVYDRDVHLEVVELATADMMMQLSAIKSEKEGDWGTSLNLEELKEMAQRIYDKYSDKKEELFAKGRIVNVGVSFEQ